MGKSKFWVPLEHETLNFEHVTCNINIKHVFIHENRTQIMQFLI